jgi:hypothetical protein
MVILQMCEGNDLTMESTAINFEFERQTTRKNTEVARWIFESLKPLRTACMENEYDFMAYLIEMTEVEAFRLMREDRSIS